MCCTGPTVQPYDRYSLGLDALYASAADPLAPTENAYSAPPGGTNQVQSTPNLWEESTQPKLQNVALLPNDGYDGQSRGITSPEAQNQVLTGSDGWNDSNEWSSLLNIPSFST